MSYNRNTFHKNTFCIFTEVSLQDIQHLKPAFTSKKESRYFFTDEGVYRESNHWGRVANCRWRLISLEKKVNQIRRMGFAKWSDFYSNNETEKLFYLEFNEAENKVEFQHKNNPNYDGKAFLRNASDTQKAVLLCIKILQTDDWASYNNVSNLDSFRKLFVQKIIEENYNLLQLKREFL